VYIDSIVALGETIGKQPWSGSSVLISPGLFAYELGALAELHAEFSDECPYRFLTNEGMLRLVEVSIRKVLECGIYSAQIRRLKSALHFYR